MGATDCFVGPNLLHRDHEGPLGPHVGDFAALLQQQGYSNRWAHQMVWVVTQFSRWLCKHRLGAEDVDAAQLKRFRAHRKRIGRIGRGDPAALQKMLNLLCKKGVVQCADSPRVVGFRERACDGSVGTWYSNVAYRLPR